MKRFLIGLSLSLATFGGMSAAFQGGTTRAEEKPAAKTKTISIESIKLTIPETWKQSEPTSRIRLAQIAVPAAAGDSEDGEIAVFVFPGGGGGIDANVSRWIKQFQDEGRKQKIVTGTSPQGKYTLVDLQGTYNKPVGPPALQKTTPMPGARALNVILQPEKGEPYFIRFTGPEKTVTAAANDYRKAFGGSADSEQEAKPGK